MATMVVEDGTAKTNSNSYCSLADADTYHEMRLHATDWTGASDANKQSALMWATRLLDELIDWYGWKYTYDQALRWPRTGVATLDGDSIEYNEIPFWLRDATAEYARILIAEDRTADNATKGFKRIVVGSGDVDITIDKSDRKRVIPPSVWSMVRCYGVKIRKPHRLFELA